MTTWVVGSLRDTPHKTIEQSVIDLGFDLVTGRYDEDSQEWTISDIPKAAPVFAHGAIKFIRTLTPYSFVPGAFGFKDYVQVSSYMRKYPRDWFLNDAGVFVRFGSLASLIPRFKALSPNGLFLRPDSGYKLFTGVKIDYDTFEKTLDDIIAKSPMVRPMTPCYLAPKKNIIAEYRFFAVGRKIVAGSQYRRNNVLDVRADFMPNCYELARKVAEFYQMDKAFVVDIAETEDGPRIVEFNSFSSSGTYAADTDAIVREVSKIW